jgi:hypothetical protein
MSEKQSGHSLQKYAGTQTEHRRRRLIGDAETASEAIIAAVATANGVEIEELPPLGDQLDTEALDRLVSSETRSPAAGFVFTRTEDISTEIEVSFEYAGYDVTISDNYVLLE